MDSLLPSYLCNKENESGRREKKERNWEMIKKKRKIKEMKRMERGWIYRIQTCGIYHKTHKTINESDMMVNIIRYVDK